MKKILVIIFVLCGAAAQAQDWRTTEWGAAYLRDSIRQAEAAARGTNHADGNAYDRMGDHTGNFGETHNLLRENSEQGTLRVEAVGDAARLLNSVPKGDLSRDVAAFRVEIFNDNTASARERAYEAYARFRELCPDIEANEGRDINYSSPKYTVRVGAFLTHDEAAALCGRLRSTFKAYVRTETMPLESFAL